MPRYTIRVRGHLAPHWSPWLAGLDLRLIDDGTTTIHGTLADQSALFSVLTKIRDLNVQLLAVTYEEAERSGPQTDRRSAAAQEE